ncbi:uncharacterized protein B0P05DRAFT_550247 [Gilbertella persicaria]|uniref:uncharacterized protein n=1 Tax=Gilbertella persicaria TaxID=101096 RepID=UPI00221F01B5|nr:uncharacterized protein B0P05DRAFT_550247 [Gilbertella persicaria]KAI8070578.1 hypothetical protein B0P05DRAFT_550247 [Gilbertella persicaria]
MDTQQIIKLNLNHNTGEFTRRKNWSSNILESLRDVVHVLNGDLVFIYCSPASSEFLGYKPNELVGHAFTEYMHVDDVDMFVRELKQSQSMMRTLKCVYRFLRKDGKYTTLETRGQFYKHGFFGHARRIPTETSQSIDAFLDLKMENEMLKRKLAMIKRKMKAHDSSEEDEDMPASNVYTQGVSASYDINQSLAMFTGLRYDLGERALGISLGLKNGELTTVNALPIKNKASDPIRLGKKVILTFFSFSLSQ